MGVSHADAQYLSLCSSIFESRREGNIVDNHFFSAGGTPWLRLNFPLAIHMTDDIRLSDQVLSEIISASPIGIAVYDGSGQCVSTNHSLALIIGSTTRQILKQNYNCIESWQKSGLLDSARKVVKSKSALRHDVVTLSSFGKEVCIDCHLIPFGTKGLLLMAQDITERKRFEDALCQTVRRLTHSHKLAKAGGWQWDIPTGNVEWLEEVYDLFGLDPNKFQPRIDAVISRFHPDDRKLKELLLKQALADRDQYSFEARIIMPDGNIRILLATSQGHFDDSGNLFQIAGTVQDITSHKLLEQQLLQTQKVEAISQLTGGIAHHFNNMLSVILGHAELLKSRLPVGDPSLESVLEIENASLCARDITRRLLTFSKKQIVAPKTTNLNQLILEKEKTLAELIGEAVELQFDPQIDLWNTRIDPAQVDEVLFNLSANARDAMPDGGVLRIKTSNIDLDENHCAMNMEFRSGRFVVLSVTDNGVGMDKEVLSHLFEPFYTTKNVGQGTGLGLATVYGIARQNGGFVTACSEPGKGTTFNFHIPKLMDNLQEDIVVGRYSLESAPATVLLVEDDDIVRKMTATILKRIGYYVLPVESPAKAMTVLKKETSSIDLLMTNLIMPQMNGPELVAEIRKVKPNLKVLFMSGYADNVILCQGGVKDGIYFVQKPFTKNDLIAKVYEALGEK